MVYYRFKGLKNLKNLMKLDPQRPLILAPGTVEHYPRYTRAGDAFLRCGDDVQSDYGFSLATEKIESKVYFV